jgi:hypothetical protein
VVRLLRQLQKRKILHRLWVEGLDRESGERWLADLEPAALARIPVEELLDHVASPPRTGLRCNELLDGLEHTLAPANWPRTATPATLLVLSEEAELGGRRAPTPGHLWAWFLERRLRLGRPLVLLAATDRTSPASGTLGLADLVALGYQARSGQHLLLPWPADADDGHTFAEAIHVLLQSLDPAYQRSYLGCCSAHDVARPAPRALRSDR